ncbi:MAG: putative Ig domain-containing protein [Chloroflexi bacterium]|nr:putative Ig domain-containing protein [Chloroflexota bacterium]
MADVTTTGTITVTVEAMINAFNPLPFVATGRRSIVSASISVSIPYQIINQSTRLYDGDPTDNLDTLGVADISFRIRGPESTTVTLVVNFAYRFIDLNRDVRSGTLTRSFTLPAAPGTGRPSVQAVALGHDIGVVVVQVGSPPRPETYSVTVTGGGQTFRPRVGTAWTGHSDTIDLTGLRASTEYTVSVVFTGGGESRNTIRRFTTQAAPAPNVVKPPAPVISFSGVRTVSMSVSVAPVAAGPNQPTSYGVAVRDAVTRALVSSRSNVVFDAAQGVTIPLSGLTPDTSYEAAVTFTNSAGSTRATATQRTLASGSVGDDLPPIIGAVVVAPQAVSVTWARSETALTATLTRNARGGVPDTYEATLGGVTRRGSWVDGAQIRFTNLQPNTSYTLAVSVTNTGGTASTTSTTSTLARQTTVTPETPETPETPDTDQPAVDPPPNAPSIRWERTATSLTAAISRAAGGGLPASYVATLNGERRSGAWTTGLRLTFSGLTPETRYSLSVTISNTSGSASAASAISTLAAAADPEDEPVTGDETVTPETPDEVTPTEETVAAPGQPGVAVSQQDRQGFALTITAAADGGTPDTLDVIITAPDATVVASQQGVAWTDPFITVASGLNARTTYSVAVTVRNGQGNATTNTTATTTQAPAQGDPAAETSGNSTVLRYTPRTPGATLTNPIMIVMGAGVSTLLATLRAGFPIHNADGSATYVFEWSGPDAGGQTTYFFQITETFVIPTTYQYASPIDPASIDIYGERKLDIPGWSVLTPQEQERLQRWIEYLGTPPKMIVLDLPLWQHDFALGADVDKIRPGMTARLFIPDLNVADRGLCVGYEVVEDGSEPFKRCYFVSVEDLNFIFDARLLEDGDTRLLEDGDRRLLEGHGGRHAIVETPIGPPVMPPGPAAPSFGSASVPAQAWTAGTAIAPVVIPAAQDGTLPLVYSAGALPRGIAFDAATRTLSGTPAAAGRGSVRITATDADGRTATLDVAYVTAAAPSGAYPHRGSITVGHSSGWTGYWFTNAGSIDSGERFFTPNGNPADVRQLMINVNDFGGGVYSPRGRDLRFAISGSAVPVDQFPGSIAVTQGNVTVVFTSSAAPFGVGQGTARTYTADDSVGLSLIRAVLADVGDQPTFELRA